MKSFFIFFIIWFLALSINPSVFAADSYTVNNASSLYIYEHSVCKLVTNSLTGGRNLFVPTKTSGEWSAFYTNAPSQPGISVANDTSAPTVSISSNPSNPTNSSSANFGFSGGDTGCGINHYECNLDSGGWSTCASVKNYSSLTTGSHTFQVRSHDQSSNTSSVSSYSWLVDLVNPTVSISAGPAASTTDTNASFTFSGFDAHSGLNHYECNLDGGGWSTCTSVKNYSGLAATSHGFSVRSHDNAGNISTASNWSWTIIACANIGESCESVSCCSGSCTENTWGHTWICE